MKNKRQDAILRIIEQKSIETQEQMLAELKAAGFKTTQATISRDIRELKLVKNMTDKGVYRYELTSRQDPAVPKFNSALTESITKVSAAGNILVIRTYPGLAQAVAAFLDSMQVQDILGCVGGDDTIIAVLPDHRSAEDLAMKIRIMLRTL